MAKINAIFGKGTGKVGPLVLQVNGGVQIMKEKPAKVSNPNTDAQAEQRAKLKLMSQLAADLQQTIAFQKKGLVSARNQFISANIGKCSFNNAEAQVELTALDLTGGSAYLPVPTATSAGAVALSAGAAASVNAVLYAAYKRDETQQLTLIAQEVISEAGENRTFPGSLGALGDTFVVFAYGIMNNGKAGVLSYDDYVASISSDKAHLGYVRSVVVKGGSLTQTSAITDAGH